jgi:hypothetical protein
MYLVTGIMSSFLKLKNIVRQLATCTECAIAGRALEGEILRNLYCQANDLSAASATHYRQVTEASIVTEVDVVHRRLVTEQKEAEKSARVESRKRNHTATASKRGGPGSVVIYMLMIVYEAVPLCYYVTGSNPGTCPKNNLNMPSVHSIAHPGQAAMTRYEGWDGMDRDWPVGVFHCDVINETLHGERESWRGSEVVDEWWDGDMDRTFDREKGLADTPWSHRRVSGKIGFLSYSKVECIQYE